MMGVCLHVAHVLALQGKAIVGAMTHEPLT